MGQTYRSTQPASSSLFLVFIGIGLLLLGGAAYFFLPQIQAKLDAQAALDATIPVQTNYVAPELSLTDAHGNPASLADYRGQVVLVNLWATWCPPCKEEMPTLQSYFEKHKADGFIIIAINDGDPQADVVQFVQDYKLTFPVWLDPTYIATEDAFKTLNLPSSFVIDRDGIIRLSWVGGISLFKLEK